MKSVTIAVLILATGQVIETAQTSPDICLNCAAPKLLQTLPA